MTQTSTTDPAPSLTTRPASPGTGTTAAPSASTSDVTRRHGSAWSAEVQALRAVAVLLVLAFHIWPARVPGGYVGVDVFFVISGFLITGHIVRDIDGERFGLGRFYVRRARRLLPAAMLVLLVVSVTVVLLLPYPKWVDSAQQILASAGYVQNWVLAGSDIDYLTPQSPPTAVQHFWSLSVEEQFYFVWPVLLAAAAWLTRRRRPRVRRLALGGVMLAVTLVSLAYGLWATAHNPAGAYFFSTTRVWEFAAGGLLALAMQSGVRALGERHHVPAGLLSWAGLAAIAASAMLYTERTAFPGYAAALPVAGALAVIAAGPVRGRWSPAPWVRLRPTQLIGDMSYSLYLWHWPLVILVPAILGDPRLGRLDKIGVLVLSLVLAWLSLTLVENRLRAGRPARSAAAAAAVSDAEVEAAGQPRGRGTAVRRWRPGPAFAMITVATLGVVAIAGGAWLYVDRRVDGARQLAVRAIADDVRCFGAADLVEPACTPPFGDDVVTPDPAGALADMRASEAWQRCFAGRGDDDLQTCSFGPADADTHLVLFGDSHALQWFSAVEQISREQGWRLTTMLRASCTPSSAFMTRRTALEQNRCHAWAAGAIAAIEADPSVDVVLTSAFNNKKWKAEPKRGLDAYQAGVQGYQDTWARLTTGGQRVVVLRDTPRPLGHMLRCVADEPSGEGCGRARGPALKRSDDWSGRADPMLLAASGARPGSVHVVDLTDAFCGPSKCPAVVGNVLVYADSNHMTPTFARTLVTPLRRDLLAVLGR